MLDKNFADLRMDQTRIPQDAQAITTTQAQALKDGEVIADDGNSYTTVQGAQDAVSSWIRLPPETFNEAVNVNTTGLSIIGSGYDSFIDGGTIGHAININSDDVTISNLRAETTAGGGNTNNAIRTSGGSISNTAVDSCWVTESDRHGIVVEIDSIVQNCHVKNADTQGILVADKQTICVGNVVKNVAGEGIRGTGHDQIVAGNVISNSTGDGIRMSNADSVCYGNREYGAGSNGIRYDNIDQIIVNNRVSSISNQGSTNGLQDSNITGASN